MRTGPWWRRAAAGAVVGVANLKMFRRENRHLARLELRVLPEQRRRGVGTALLGAAERIAADTGRSELAGMDETPLRPDYVDTTEPFALHHGFSVAQRMVRRCIDLPLSAEHADALRRHPKASPSGYSLVTFADRWPDEDLDDRCELGRRMSTDVPTGRARCSTRRSGTPSVCAPSRRPWPPRTGPR